MASVLVYRTRQNVAKTFAQIDFYVKAENSSRRTRQELGLRNGCWFIQVDWDMLANPIPVGVSFPPGDPSSVNEEDFDEEFDVSLTKEESREASWTGKFVLKCICVIRFLLGNLIRGGMC